MSQSADKKYKMKNGLYDANSGRSAMYTKLPEKEREHYVWIGALGTKS